MTIVLTPESDIHFRRTIRVYGDAVLEGEVADIRGRPTGRERPCSSHPAPDRSVERFRDDPVARRDPAPFGTDADILRTPQLTARKMGTHPVCLPIRALFVTSASAPIAGLDHGASRRTRALRRPTAHMSPSRWKPRQVRTAAHWPPARHGRVGLGDRINGSGRTSAADQEGPLRRTVRGRPPPAGNPGDARRLPVTGYRQIAFSLTIAISSNEVILRSSDGRVGRRRSDRRDKRSSLSSPAREPNAYRSAGTRLGH